MADYITMKQVPGGTVTAKDDRIVYDANMADSGIIYGCAITYAGNNMIHIGAGYGIIKGGMFEMEDHTEYVDLAENEPTTGQIYLHLDLSADDKLTIVKETTNSLHPMVQNADANFTNGIYELQLCTFTATTTALEDVTQTFAVIQNQVLDTLPEIMANTTAGLKAGALALKEVSENLNAMVDTRYNQSTGEPEWKEQGADTWHPFSSKFTTCISGNVSYNTSSYSSNFTLDKDCNHIVVLLQCGGNNSAYITSYSVKQNGQTLTQNVAGSYLPNGWLNWIMAEYVGSFKSGDIINCSYSLSHQQSYLTSGIMY